MAPIFIAVGAGIAAVVAWALASGKPKDAEAAKELPPGGSPPVPGVHSTIRKGTKSADVAAWQKVLGVKEDGIFGPVTEAATKAYQTKHGLVADGIVGPKTWAASTAPGGVFPATGSTAGATSVTPEGDKDAAFDTLVAKAIAEKNVNGLALLALNAEQRGLHEQARSIVAEIARIKGDAPIAVTPGPNKPVTPSVAKPTGRAILSMAAHSKGADVIEWQKVCGTPTDGVFGPATDKCTRAWQSAHGLASDGIVGPATWAKAYQAAPALATTPRPAVVVTTPAVRPLLRLGSSGPNVVEWQTILQKAYGPSTVAADGKFGSVTDVSTRAWQKAHGLTADGIVGPATWAEAYKANPSLAVTPVATVQAAKVAAPPLPPTAMVKHHETIRRGSTGEDVKTWQRVLGITADGSFGPITETVTKGWQQGFGLTPDGIVGPKTWATVPVNPNMV